MMHKALCLLVAVLYACGCTANAHAQILDHQRQLEAQSFWDNRDWDWYKANIPFFECPDAEINTTYYYRWELLTKHLTYGSRQSGYSFTEFIDRPFWSGAFGAISCPAGFQLYEARWLRSPEIANDYTRYWFRTPGAQPRNYSTWIADSAWAVHQVHPNKDHLVGLLHDLIENYEGWEKRHFVESVGLFWQTGHDDGMEFNINSRQTQDILRGAPSFRPSFNAYMWADAVAIARIAKLAGDEPNEKKFQSKAEKIKERVQTLLWDEKRAFFFPKFRDNEERDGHKIRAGTLTYESGQFEGDSHGRELIGYVPWQFEMLDDNKGFEQAWSKLMSSDGFYAEYGPCTVERQDPMFLLKNSCCWWSGQSWPYATTQTLKGLANLLQKGHQEYIHAKDYISLLKIFAKSHRKDGKPYLAEALHPDTGSFEGHDGYNHSEHYFHSGFCDLIITGLVGIVPRNDNVLELKPLAPTDWDYFCLDSVPYKNHVVSIVWDKSGDRYKQGSGLSVFANGNRIAHSDKLEAIQVSLPDETSTEKVAPTTVKQYNFAVNNEGSYYPRISASFTATGTSVAKLNDGNYWYAQHPPNRWTCENTPNKRDWVELDFGTERTLDSIKLYFLDDDGAPPSRIRAPKSVSVQAWRDGSWVPLQLPATIQASRGVRGHTATSIPLSAVRTTKIRIEMEHQGQFASGLTEIEAWGKSESISDEASPPAGNLAFSSKPGSYPKATASHSDRFGGQPANAIDGKTVFLPTPMNRWTSYESKTKSDWLEIDFGQRTEFRRIELAIYDDRGGVQPPESFVVEYWTGSEWKQVTEAVQTPEKPAGSQWNSVVFQPVQSTKVRLVFTHRGEARSGVSEVMVWND